MSRKLFMAATWAAVLASLGPAACGDSDGGGASSQGGNAPEGYADSACGLCVKDACAGEVDACAGDPGCAHYLGCLYDCAVDATGNADPACVAGCPIPDSSTARAARDALEACRAYGRGATQCPACGIANNTHPLLNQECAASADPNACYKCEDERCCETYATCKANPACDALVMCLQACPDVNYEACADGCEADHPDGVADFGARIGCVLVFCADPSACGSAPITPCSHCVNVECADEFITCWADADCYLISGCTAACNANDEACFQACYDAHPAGVQAFTDFGLCSTQSCGAECG